MKKNSILLLAIGLLVSACLPAPAQPTTPANPQSDVDLAATAVALAATMSAQTLAALPSATPVPTEVVMQEPSETSTLAFETPPDASSLTGTPDDTIAATATATITATPGVSKPPTVTLTSTLGPLQAGSVPAGTDYSPVKLINKANRQAYISLYWTGKDGTEAFFGYPVHGQTKVKIPAGRYSYVAWVGGKQMTGSFKLDNSGSATITLYKDKVSINN